MKDLVPISCTFLSFTSRCFAALSMTIGIVMQPELSLNNEFDKKCLDSINTPQNKYSFDSAYIIRLSVN